MRDKIDMENPFERGWLLHLFTDACWDEHELMEYKSYAESFGNAENWFSGYRNEIGLATYYLYHHLPWAKQVWDLIKNADLSMINTSLPISQSDAGWYRDRVVARHFESEANIKPEFFTHDKILNFSQNTAARYKAWLME